MSRVLGFRMALAWVLLCCFSTGSGLAGDYDAARKEVLRILQQNIHPFWFPGVVDSEHGGFKLNHDAQGQWQGHGAKGIVTQARTVWYLSHLVRKGYGKAEDLEAARHGFRFLKERLWDAEFGGFYWSVNCEGDKALMPDKHLYGQSFGLYALSEYYLASGDSEALELADELFQLIESKAHDRKWGGYTEHFQRDWGRTADDSTGYMGAGANVKLMNTHLHLMEAVTTYVMASRNPVARERLLELITIESNAVVRKDLGACTDRYQVDWTPLRGAEFEIVSYGHDVENVWLLMDACLVAGISDGPLNDLYETLMAYSLKHGYDEREGGFFSTGSFESPANDRTKVWWVQSEGLVAALRMYERTGEKKYWDVFEGTLNWVSRKQVDWQHGDWHANVTESGETNGAKAGLWKSPYHNGRAVLELLEVLDRLSTRQ